MSGLEFTKNWYGKSLPKKMDSKFAEFAAKSASLAFKIAPGFLRVDAKAETAYIDPNGIAYLPGKYFDAKYMNELGVPEADHVPAAVSLINGSTIHESLHRLLTSPYLIPAKLVDNFLNNSRDEELVDWLSKKFDESQIDKAVAKYNEFTSKKANDSDHRRSLQRAYEASNLAKAVVVLDQITLSCIQLIEDIFNENLARSRFSTLSDFLDSKNAILFHEADFIKRVEAFDESGKVADFINALITLKNVEARTAEFWDRPELRPFFDQVMLAEDEGLNHCQRSDIAVRLSYMLQEESDMEQPEQNGEGVTAACLSIDGEEGQDQEGRISSEAEGIIKAFESAVRDGELKQMKLDVDSTIMPTGEFDLSRVAKVELIDVKGRRNTRHDLRYDNRFLKFAQSLKYSLEQKLVYGPIRERGPEISKKYLNQIVHSNKIFTRRDTIGRERGKPEVILLVDFSGSMTYKHVKNELGVEEALSIAAMRAAYGAHISMNRSGIPNAVYSHTTGGELRNDAPVVYAISSYNMPFMGKPHERTTSRNVHERFLAAASQSSSENYDGFAIREASKHFSVSESDKILVVLSDGQPSATYYSNDRAVEHTHNIVRILRRDGIQVFSMSLIPEVVAINDQIYGQSFNMRAYGSNLGKNMEEVLRKAILGD